MLVPANRFEMLECLAALDAVAGDDLDGAPRGPGPLDVLCQHILLRACAGPFDADALYAEVGAAGPYRALPRADFDDCLDFCATGGYALRAYDRWQRLVQRDGRWQLRDPRRARAIRMNVGTIVAPRPQGAPQGRGGAPLGRDRGGLRRHPHPRRHLPLRRQTVRYECLREMTVEVTRRPSTPKVAVYGGTKFATSTHSRTVSSSSSPTWTPGSASPTTAGLAGAAGRGQALIPGEASSWWRPSRTQRHLLLGLPFEGRLAHKTLGLLLTLRMERHGGRPAGFRLQRLRARHVRPLRMDGPSPLLTPEDLGEGSRPGSATAP